MGHSTQTPHYCETIASYNMLCAWPVAREPRGEWCGLCVGDWVGEASGDVTGVCGKLSMLTDDELLTNNCHTLLLAGDEDRCASYCTLTR